MAYGVKYKLEFTDNQLNDKKIEILKDGYVKAQPTDPDLTIYDLVGTKNPCVIEWQTDDNFYSPIKGSTCTLNLFVTENTNYDDFYASDEREYQVKISYKNTGGTYDLFWIGWIVVDQFQEAIITKPFEITLKAFDGLGTLDKYNYPIDKTTIYQKSYIYIIANILKNLNLDLDIYTSNDIRQYNPSGTYYSIYDELGDVGTGFQDGWFVDEYGLQDAKSVLEVICKITNSRIFQSLGRWYIISNSNYSEYSLQSSIASTTSSTGTPPSGIRDSETSYLKTNATEEPRFVIYDKDGVYDSTVTNVNVLKVLSGNSTTLNSPDAPNGTTADLINLGGDLVKEYLSPANNVNLIIDLRQNYNDILLNAGFEYDTTEWSTSSVTGSGAIATNISLQGLQSYKTTGTTSFANRLTPDSIIHQTKTVFYNADRKFKMEFSYYNEDTVSTGTKEFALVFYLLGEDIPGGTSISRYLINNGTVANPSYVWSDESSLVPIIININENNSWNEVELDIPMIPSAFTNNYDQPSLKVTLHEPYLSDTSGYTAFYYDNIKFYEITSGGKDIFTPSNSVTISRTQSGTNNFSNKIEVKDVTQSSEMQRYQYFKGKLQGTFARSRENHSSLDTSIDKIITQEILNDYRTFLVRYSGNLYNLSTNKIPLSLHNKVWVNFGSSVLLEPVSAYIDGMVYDVKENTFQVNLHLPNQDNDVASDVTIQFKK